MNHPDQSRRNRGRRRPPPRTAAVDIWRTPAPLPEIEPITTPPDPTAALRSLGPPRCPIAPTPPTTSQPSSNAPRRSPPPSPSAPT